MNKLFSAIGGRKMFFALILMIIVSTILFADKCNFDQWSNFVIWVFGTYALGNIGEHVAEKFGKKN